MIFISYCQLGKVVSLQDALIYSPSISCTVFLGLLLVLFALSFTDFQSSGVIWV